MDENDAEKQGLTVKNLENIPQALDVNEPRKILGFFSFLKLVISNVTIEPQIFLFSFGFMLMTIPTTYLIMERTCQLDEGYSFEMCQKILYNDTFKEEKTTLQGKVSSWLMIQMVASLIPDVLFKLLSGSWSDKHGRKPIFIICTTGALIKGLGMLLTVHYEEAGVLWLIVASLPGAILSSSAIFPIAIAYISDISVVESRTKRLIVMEVFLVLGMLAGVFTGGYMRDEYGYKVVYLVAMFANAAALLYTMFVIKETQRFEKDSQNGVCILIKDFFDLRSIKESWLTFTKKRTGRIRLHIILLMVASLVHNLLRTCHDVIDSLYAQAMYDWTSTQFGTAKTIIYGVNFLLAAMSYPILIGKMKLSDLILAIIGFLSACINYIFSAFSYLSWLFYLGWMLGFLGGLPDVVIQSNITKIVDPSELGKIMSLRAALMALGGPETNIGFLALYKACQKFFRGMPFLVAGILYIIPMSFFFVMYMKPVETKDTKEEKSQEVSHNITSAKDESEIKTTLEDTVYVTRF
ncbi:Uncharacterised protein g8564 [Pycnogonum litorale]